MQQNEFRIIFDNCDEGNKGGLILKEFIEAVSQIIGVEDVDRCVQIFKIMDIDEDHQLSWNDFKRIAGILYENKGNDQESKLKSLFRLIDSNNSDSISVEELQYFFKKTNIAATKEEVKKYIDSADLNKDGELQLNEFLLLFK
ncbi:calmodulin-like [Entamoeba marina]